MSISTFNSDNARAHVPYRRCPEHLRKRNGFDLNADFLWKSDQESLTHLKERVTLSAFADDEAANHGLDQDGRNTALFQLQCCVILELCCPIADRMHAKRSETNSVPILRRGGTELS